MNDLHNNALGRELPLDPKNKGRPAEDVIMEALYNGVLQTRPPRVPGSPRGVSTPSYDDYGWLGRKPKPRKP